jgi:hypothetical protein
MEVFWGKSGAASGALPNQRLPQQRPGTGRRSFDLIWAGADRWPEFPRSIAARGKRALGPGDGGGVVRLQRKIGGLHWDAGDRDHAGACFTAGLELLGDDRRGSSELYRTQVTVTSRGRRRALDVLPISQGAVEDTAYHEHD